MYKATCINIEDRLLLLVHLINWSWDRFLFCFSSSFGFTSSDVIEGFKITDWFPRICPCLHLWFRHGSLLFSNFPIVGQDHLVVYCLCCKKSQKKSQKSFWPHCGVKVYITSFRKLKIRPHKIFPVHISTPISIIMGYYCYMLQLLGYHELAINCWIL